MLNAFPSDKVAAFVRVEEIVETRPGAFPCRKYEDAVKMFQPYDRVQEVNEGVRSAGAKLISEGILTPHRKTYIYLNNRLEGNALQRIEAMLSAALSTHVLNIP